MSSSKATSTNMAVRQCELFATKLYHQCRDSTSSYKTLTSSIRSLRNILGEIDETLDSRVDPGPEEKVLYRVVDCKSLLEKLDIALVSFKCSRPGTEFDDHEIIGFRTSVENVTRDLARAHAVMSQSSSDTLSSSNGSIHMRHDSQTSSAWSLANRDTSSDHSGHDSPLDQVYEGKEAIPEESVSSKANKPVPSWRAVFTDIDPMSVPWEDASKLLVFEVDDTVDEDMSAEALREAESAESTDDDDDDDDDADADDDADDEVVASHDMENNDDTETSSDTTHEYDPREIIHKDAINIFTKQEDLPTSFEDEDRDRQDSPFPEDSARPTKVDRATEADSSVLLSSNGDVHSKINQVLSSWLSDTGPGETVDPSATPDSLVETPDEKGKASTVAAPTAPEMPVRAPPPPPPSISNRPVLPEIKFEAEMITLSLSLPSSPGASEMSEDDLYSSTPPINAKSTAEDSLQLWQPLHLPEKLVQVQAVGAGDSNLSSVKTLPQASVKPTNSLRDQRYYVADAVNEQNQASPEAVSGDGHMLSKATSCSALPQLEGEENGKEDSLAKATLSLQVPLLRSRYSHQRRKSAPAAAAAASPPSATAAITDRRKSPASNREVDAEKTPTMHSPPEPRWSPRKSADEALSSRPQSILHHQHRINWESPDSIAIPFSFPGFYRPEREVMLEEMIKRDRILAIVENWNHRRWDEAEQLLLAHLEVVAGDEQAVRRVQHLLAVCSSFRGSWRVAIRRFTRVIRAPVNDISKLDDGDCAAMYWLGDLYAMLNLRPDALLAYSVAERSSIFNDPANPSGRSQCMAEQAAVALGLSKRDFMQRWTRQAISTERDEALPSLLDPSIVSIDVAKLVLGKELRKQPPNHFYLLQGQTRSSYMHGFQQAGHQSQAQEQQALKITVNVFDENSPWPMPYDPLFCMANVRRGRLLAHECDMLKIVQSNPGTKLPRLLNLLGKFDCFTCNDLPWLIATIRVCLRTYEMSYSEIVNVKGVWFCCRYSFVQNRVATTHYFAIALFKHPLRSGYVADICSDDGMCSARLVSTDVACEKGVHTSEPRRIKKMIREYLDEAARARLKFVKDTSADTLPPPVPPRPPTVAKASNEDMAQPIMAQSGERTRLS